MTALLAQSVLDKGYGFGGVNPDVLKQDELRGVPAGRGAGLPAPCSAPKEGSSESTLFSQRHCFVLCESWDWQNKLQIMVSTGDMEVLN